MSSSPSAVRRSTVLREGAVRVIPARIDADLRTNPYAKDGRSDPRLVDPTLVRAFDELAEDVRVAARSEGFDAGYADGLAQGRAEAERVLESEREAAREALRHREADLTRALDLLTAATAELEARQTAALADVELLLLDAAFQVAEAVVGRELELATAPVKDAVARALTLVPADAEVAVRLHPDDAALFDADWAQGRAARVVADPTMARGDCIVDAGPTRVDARISAALARVRQVLAP